jgi:hypothetical protein
VGIGKKRTGTNGWDRAREHRAGTEQAVGTRGEITELEKTRGWEQTVETEDGKKR